MSAWRWNAVAKAAEAGPDLAQLIERIAIFQRELQQAIAAGESQFLDDVRTMRFNRAGTDEKFGGDFLVGPGPSRRV